MTSSHITFLQMDDRPSDSVFIYEFTIYASSSSFDIFFFKQTFFYFGGGGHAFEFQFCRKSICIFRKVGNGKERKKNIISCRFSNIKEEYYVLLCHFTFVDLIIGQIALTYEIAHRANNAPVISCF
jgi:hypothetical protein